MAIGWLSGSLTGISAILYAIGYLVTSAYLYSLGIDARLVNYGNQFFLQRGAVFLLVSGTLLTHIMPLVGMLAAAAGLAYWVAFAGPVRRRLAPRFDRLRVASRLPSGAGRVAVFLLLVILLGVRLIPDLDLFRATLTISQRLYAPTHPVGDPGQASIREALRTQNTAELELQYVQLLVNEIVTILALVAAYYVTREWHYQLLMVAPFALVFLSHTVFLPMSYGVLMVPLDFERADLVPADPAGSAAADGPYLLLNKSSEDFILWDIRRKAVVWIPLRQVQRAVFTRADVNR